MEIDDPLILNLSKYTDEHHLVTDLKDIVYHLYWQYQDQKKYRSGDKNEANIFLDYLEKLCDSHSHDHKFVSCMALELDCRQKYLFQIVKLFEKIPNDIYSFNEFDQLIRMICPRINASEYLKWIQWCEGIPVNNVTGNDAMPTTIVSPNQEMEKDKFISYFSVIFLYFDFLKMFAQSLHTKQGDYSLSNEDGVIDFLEFFEHTCQIELGQGQYPPFHLIEPVFKSVIEKVRNKNNANLQDEKSIQIQVIKEWLHLL